MPQPDNPAQNPAVPAEPAAPAPPAVDPVPTPAPDDGGQPAPAPDDDGGAQPTPDDGGGEPAAPQQSRQERRDQERQQRKSAIGELTHEVQQGGQPNQQFPGGQQSPQFPNYEDGQTVTPQQLQQDVVQTASAIANLQVQHQLQQRDAVNNFERDTEAVPTKYAELNPDNAAYTPEMDEAIAQEFQERAFKVVGYDAQGRPVRQLDPSVRLSAIAERHVKAARAYAAKSNSNMQTAVDQAADSAAPRPTGAKPTEKPFESLSLAEMKARVGYHKS